MKWELKVNSGQTVSVWSLIKIHIVHATNWESNYNLSLTLFLLAWIILKVWGTFFSGLLNFWGLYENSSGFGMAALLLVLFFGWGRKITIGATWQTKQDNETGNDLRQTSEHPAKPDKRRSGFHTVALCFLCPCISHRVVSCCSQSHFLPSNHTCCTPPPPPLTQVLAFDALLEEQREVGGGVDPGQRLFCFSATKWWSHWHLGAN